MPSILFLVGVVANTALIASVEHAQVGAAVLRSPCRHDPGAVTSDPILPAGPRWLTLHGSLHRVHHCHPGLRWYEAPARLREDASAEPIPYALFVRRWKVQGPGRWPAGSDAHTESCAATS